MRGSDQEVSVGHAHAHDTAPPPLGSVVHVLFRELGSLAVIDFLTPNLRILPPQIDPLGSHPDFFAVSQLLRRLHPDRY